MICECGQSMWFYAKGEISPHNDVMTEDMYCCPHCDNWVCDDDVNDN